MTKRPGPSVRRRQLGAMLRELRSHAGISRKDAAEWIGVGEQSMSKIELGKVAIKDGNVRSLCQLYDVEANNRDTLLRLARESTQRGWWSAYRDTLPDWARQLVGQESEARDVWAYESELIPGLLQTSDYVAAINRGMDPEMSEERIARAQELRKKRQSQLDANDPPQLHFYLNEAVIRRVVGSPEIMAAQLDYLAKAATLDYVELRVLPFSAGAHPAMSSSFVLVQLPEEEKPAFAYVENDRGATYQESPADLDRYMVMVQLLDEKAASQAASRDLFEQAAEHLRKNSEAP